MAQQENHHPQDPEWQIDIFAHLTEREREVLNEVVRGLPNKEIAVNLAISEHTVKVHVRNLLRKLHVHSRVAATVLWLTSHQYMNRTADK